jgi:hypothetical protein
LTSSLGKPTEPQAAGWPDRAIGERAIWRNPGHMSDRARWGRIGRVAGIFAGTALLLQTLLFLADETDLLDASPDFHKTSLGASHDIATYYAAYLNHLHAIVWDIAVRDALGPAAYVGFMVLGLAIFSLLRADPPERSLLLLFFTVGGVLAASSDLVYLSTVQYAQYGDWHARPYDNMIAAGRSVEAINDVTVYTQLAGFLVLALGLVCLARITSLSGGLSSLLRAVAYLEAIGLVGIVLTRVLSTDIGYDVMALATGVVLAPMLGLVGARDVGRMTGDVEGVDQPLSSSASMS